MISFLKGLGYKLTTKDELISKQFRLDNAELVINEELTTLTTERFTEVQSYSLFLNNKDYTVAKLKKIITEARKQSEVIDTQISYEIDEKGYQITIIFTKES